MTRINPELQCRYIQKQWEKWEHPYKYRASRVPTNKNEMGTVGTNFNYVPIVPISKKTMGTVKPTSILTVPTVPTEKHIYPHYKRRKGRSCVKSCILERKRQILISPFTKIISPTQKALSHYPTGKNTAFRNVRVQDTFRTVAERFCLYHLYS